MAEKMTTKNVDRKKPNKEEKTETQKTGNEREKSRARAYTQSKEKKTRIVSLQILCDHNLDASKPLEDIKTKSRAVEY